MTTTTRPGDNLLKKIDTTPPTAPTHQQVLDASVTERQTVQEAIKAALRPEHAIAIRQIGDMARLQTKSST